MPSMFVAIVVACFVHPVVVELVVDRFVSIVLAIVAIFVALVSILVGFGSSRFVSIFVVVVVHLVVGCCSIVVFGFVCVVLVPKRFAIWSIVVGAVVALGVSARRSFVDRCVSCVGWFV